MHVSMKTGYGRCGVIIKNFIVLMSLIIVLFPNSFPNINEKSASVDLYDSDPFQFENNIYDPMRNFDDSPKTRSVRLFVWKIRCQCEDTGGINNDVEIFFTVDVNGQETRFPPQDYYELSNGAEKIIDTFVFSELSLSQSLTINVHVWDDDSPLSNDDLGQFTVVHDPSDNFGDTGDMGVDKFHYRDEGDWSFWYWVETGDPPQVPTLLTPLDMQSFNSTLPVFSWNFNPGDDPNQGAFCVQIDDSPQFTSPEFTSGDMESSLTQWTPAGLDDGIWYWRISTRDTIGAWGNWSSTGEFLLDHSPPSVDLAYPAGGDKLYGNVSIKVTASDSISGISRVDFYYKLNAKYFFIGSRNETTANFFQMYWDTSTLAEDTSYHIRVIGFNGVGLSREDKTHIFIEINRPDTPFVELLSPQGGENFSGDCEVRWRSFDKDTDEALQFRLALSDDSGVTFSNATAWLTEDETRTSGNIFNFSLDLTAYQNASTYRLRVFVTDSSPLTLDVNDTMEKDFSIHHPKLNFPPLVIIEYPQEGRFAEEIWISYNATDPNGGDILFITIWFQAKGGDWQLLVRDTENTGEYCWNLSDIPEDLYKLRIEVSDGKVISAAEMDEYLLSIYRNNPPQAVILAPEDDSVFNNHSPISFISGAFDLDNDNITVRWSSDMDGLLYEGANSTFSTALSSGTHNISFQVWDEYGYTDEQWIYLHISEYEILYYSDIYVENIVLPSIVVYGEFVMINITIKNSGNIGGNVTFVLRAVMDNNAEDSQNIGTGGPEILELFHDIVGVAAGDIYIRQVIWMPDSPGFYLVKPVITDNNRSNDGASKRIEIYRSSTTDDLEREILLEPFYYTYPLIVFLVLLFIGIVIVHRFKRRRIENRTIIDQLIGAGDKDLKSTSDENMRNTSSDLDSPRLHVDKGIAKDHVSPDNGLPAAGTEKNGPAGESKMNIMKIMGEIIADFEELDVSGPGNPPNETSGQIEADQVTQPYLAKIDENTVSTSSEKNMEEKLPERVREIFDGL